jgi:hypothetical protein
MYRVMICVDPDTTDPDPQRRITNPRGQPRPRRRGVVWQSVTLLSLLSSPALTQVVPTGSPTADFLLAQALAEHRLFLSCSALDPPVHAQIRLGWEEDVNAAVAILTKNGVAAEAIAAFIDAARPENLMPSPETFWIEVQSLCATQPDWHSRYFNQILISLDAKLPQAFP